MTAFFRRIAVGTLCLALPGCTAIPKYHPPAPEVPQRWSEAPQSNLTVTQSALAWWTDFHDSKLDSLIKRAIDANLDVQLAKARLRQSRAGTGVVAASLLSSITATASYSRERDSQNAPSTVLVSPTGQIESSNGQADNHYQTGFDASWEADLFGGRRRTVDAAQAEAESSYYELGIATLSLLAEVTRNYIDLRSAQQQIALTRSGLAARQDMLSLVQARRRGGLASDVDIVRTETQLSLLAERLPLLESSSKKSMHRLSVLLGLPPGALNDELTEAGAIPIDSSSVPTGLPSDLLRQRPDIQRAERQVAVAAARLGIATTDLYPRFSLTGSVGLASISASDFFSNGSLLWKIGPTLTWPILRRGQILATIQVRDAEQQAALIAYRQAILRGLEDTENAIAGLAHEQERQTTLSRDVEKQRQAVDLIRSRYIGGLTDFRDVLDAQHALFQRQSELVQSQAAVATAMVALYKALGGGWAAALMQSAGNPHRQE